MSVTEERESIVLHSEGQKLFGILHLPKGVSKPPCILICHGLGGHKTGRFRIYVDLAEALLKRGIASFRFDFRGSGDSEGLFADMTLQGQVQDALQAFGYLKNEKRIDVERIGVFGRSMGGAVAVLSSAQSQMTKSLALWAPMFNGDDWRHMWEYINSGQASQAESEEMRRINGQVASMNFYAQMFDMRIDQALPKLESVPMLFMHGINDEVIHHGHSEQYVELRKRTKALTRFVSLPHADHDFSHTEERKSAIELTADWFVETLC